MRSVYSSHKLRKPIPFWGICGHYPRWFPKREFYLVSAAGLWWDCRGKVVRRRYPSPRTRMFLDGGGFTFFSKQGDYPFSPDEYLKLVEHPYYGYRPLLWAALDYPCEPEIVRSSQSNLDRIEATLDHLSYLKRYATHEGMVPVVQGYTLDERFHCLDRMASAGLTSSFMAIGSLCALPDVKKIDEIVTAIGDYAEKNLSHPVAWHLFGVKTSYFKLTNSTGWPYVFSFDTAAWELGNAGETKNARGQAELEFRFHRYRDRISEILNRPRQVPLTATTI